MNSTRIIQSYWPLALLKRKLPLSDLRIATELGVLNSPCFAIIDEDGSCKVAYHTPVLQCFERLHSDAIEIPAGQTWPRFFAAHTMLLSMSEKIFGPVTSTQSLPTLTPENGQFFSQFAESEQWPMDNRTLRVFTVSLCCELLFGVKILALHDESAKAHFLKSILPMLQITEKSFPEKDSFVSFFHAMRQVFENNTQSQSLVNLRAQLEAFLYDSSGGSLHGGRINEVVLKDKARVLMALQRANDWFLNRHQSNDDEDDEVGFVSQIGGAEEVHNPDLDDDESGNLMESWFGQNNKRREISQHIGPYIVREKLGVGGMGSVYLGQAIDGQQVAVKLMNAHLKDSVSDMMRFGREVEIALALKHPHIVEALDHGVTEGQAYLTLEHMAGGSLGDRIAGGKTLDEDTLWSVILQIASALDYAWNLPKQFMHRDIKADNILFDSDDRAKLADFGLAAGVSPEATRFTNPGMTVGTPLYMSPEQVLDSSNVDTRADLWSLGVLAFRCLTGAYPFSTKETVGLYVEICTAEPADCDELLAPLSESSRDLILKLLSKDPNDRFQSAGDLIDAMNRTMPHVETSTELTQSHPRQKEQSSVILPGANIKGYKIDRELGRGGMGVVYLARRNSDNEVFVLKFLTENSDAQARKRFLREAHMLQSIEHPNIATLIEVGEGEQPFIVMEYLEGGSLGDQLTKKPCLDPRKAAIIIRDLALALAEGHKRGVIHRDVKPENIVLSVDGVPKLIDFGLAKTEHDDAISLAGQAIGTPYYMAPEQWGAHRVDARCDIFSLGVTFYELVTGFLPFPYEDDKVIMKKMIGGEFKAPRGLTPELSEQLELVIFRMLEPDRSDRYHSATSVAQDIDKALNGEKIDIPCLIQELENGEKQRHALMPGKRFIIGRGDQCAISLKGKSISRTHAEIERGPTGFSVRDLGSSYGTIVNSEMRLPKNRWVHLKDQDKIQFGQVSSHFHHASFSKSSKTSSLKNTDRSVEAIPAPLVEALVKKIDKRVVLHIIEQLAPDHKTRELASAREIIGSLYGADDAKVAMKELEKRLARRAVRLMNQAFIISHENHKDNILAWLQWWDDKYRRYPKQLGPKEPVPNCKLESNRSEQDDYQSVLRWQGKDDQEKDPEDRQLLNPDSQSFHEGRSFSLEDRVRVSIGRGDNCDLTLKSQSVSRHHATILRFHRRYVIRDNGSRFGTLVNGQKQQMAFLNHGDELTFGKVNIVFEESPANIAPGEDSTVLISPQLFTILESLGHPGVAHSLIRYTLISNSDHWMEAEVAKLFEDSEQIESMLTMVKKGYLKKERDARKHLAKILGGPEDQSAEQWLERFQNQRASLPVQVSPDGWFPED